MAGRVMEGSNARLLLLWCVGFVLPPIVIGLDFVLAAARQTVEWVALLAYVPFAMPYIMICALAIFMSGHRLWVKALLVALSAIALCLQLGLISFLGVLAQGITGTQ